MGNSHRGVPTTSFIDVLDARAKPRDALFIGMIPLILIGVFLLPMELRKALSFHTARPTLLTAFSSHFVHYSLRHLLVNLLGYASIAPLTYVLSVLAGRRRQFLAVSGGLLLGLPFSLSIVYVATLPTAPAIGFSGIVLGFYGYLPISLYQCVSIHLDGRLPSAYLPSAIFVGLASIGVVLFWTAMISLLPLLIIFLIISAFASRILDRNLITGVGRLGKGGFAETMLVGILMIALFPVAAFQSIAGTGILNIVGHFFGYLFSAIGSLLATLGFRESA